MMNAHSYGDGLDMFDKEVGIIPPTPTERGAFVKIPEAYSAMLEVSMKYGYLVGYAQEQDGKYIQHVYPVKSFETDQISNSSKTQLELHTETAFHPYRPDYIVLGCLRGDKAAKTTYAHVDTIVSFLDSKTVDTLTRPEFITTVDQSFRLHGEPDQEVLLPILTTDKDTGRWRMTFDKSTMRGTNPEAQRALDLFAKAVEPCVREISLQRGDFLVIDNSKIVHGRTPFPARYDGTDRWLIRGLVRKELPPFNEREGSVITTTRFSRQEPELQSA
jgi:L-asparagine oxygenase